MKVSFEKTLTMQSSSAVTVAERGKPSIRPISPKISLFSKIPNICLSPWGLSLDTSTEPSSIIYAQSPKLPSSIILSPFLKLIVFTKPKTPK